MPRYRLTIAYEGTAFHGWQRQVIPATTPDEGEPSNSDAPGRTDLRTVQNELEQAVRFVVREPIHVLGASRTDAGVHARAQTAAFTCSEERTGPPDERMAEAINSRLAQDALVLSCVRTHDDFDPISDCVEKGYRYTFWTGRIRPLWTRRFVFHTPFDVDADAMAAAAPRLVGTHDFAAFAKAGHGRESTVRTVTALDVRQPGEHTVTVDIAGTGFLHNMVRIIAGTLLEIGRGRLPADRIDEALRTGDRRLAGATLPPQGLCLEWMRYAGEEAPAQAVAAATGPLDGVRGP